MKTQVKLSNRRKLLKLAFHRNGICGRAFEVAILSEPSETQIGKRKKMLAVYFPGDDVACAVFDLEKLVQEEIRFGVNSYRGDRYSDDMKAIHEEAERG